MDKLENVIYLAKGGFGTVYKASWLDGFIRSSDEDIWCRKGEQSICLKSLDNLTNKNDFLQEIKNQLKFRGKNSVAIYGITKNPTENEYMMIMNYAQYGSLRKLLNNKFVELTWGKKSSILFNIIYGLKNIHEMGLIHKDFHSGNIVNQNLNLSYITDFGLCKPVSENDPEKIYGVIPYMAPETLSRGEYTKASDIYSFGMVMLEVLTSYPPYYNIPHNENLAMDICKGLKPEIKCEIPQYFKEIIEKCWNFDPLNRPTTEELCSQLRECFDGNEIRKQVKKQIKVAKKSNKDFIKYDPNEMHPEAIYTSRLIPKITIPEYDTFNSRQNFFSIPDNIIEYKNNNEDTNENNKDNNTNNTNNSNKRDRDDDGDDNVVVSSLDMLGHGHGHPKKALDIKNVQHWLQKSKLHSGTGKIHYASLDMLGHGHGHPKKALDIKNVQHWLQVWQFTWRLKISGFYSITKDSDAHKYMVVVLKYLKDGNLRNY
ncbi:hypothetical protein Glove_91g143 [Diversispora epigaea]|uniref:Protein kinase domain-containing protein n=1 Tax=Diversispora epigaea TaxID=1348612 RepID=A0A397J9U1_9GLOM|nr:hypothetical protein Glove_91g143 [Diversispora epigaea]